MKIKYILYICVLSALVMGCAKPPLADMESARTAVFTAENDADAVLYGSSSLSRARDALRNMQQAADDKRYDAAKTFAADAKAAAERAINDGKTGAVRAREESATLLSSLRHEIDETNRNIAGARQRNLDLDYNSLDMRIRNAYASADLADADYAQGKYQDALNRARVIRADLFEINQLISNAVTRKK
jgi:hypothetical protein